MSIDKIFIQPRSGLSTALRKFYYFIHCDLPTIVGDIVDAVNQLFSRLCDVEMGNL